MDQPPARRPAGPMLFRQGFRPFFLLAGLVAVGVIAVWVAALYGMPLPDGPLSLQRWHAHEMLAAFLGAAMAGFLLTAVPNWLGGPAYGGTPLAIAAGFFLAAWVALAPGSPVPLSLAAVLDLLPLPLLLLWIAPALIQSGRARLFGPPALVLGVWTGDLLMLGSAAGWWGLDTWNTGQRLAIDVAILLVGLIGGRIVPLFTMNSLSKRGVTPDFSPWIPKGDEMANLALAGIVVVDIIMPCGEVAGAFAAGAALLCALRLSRWNGWKVADDPILLVLHVAWAFVPLGLAIKAAALLGGPPWLDGAWLHLLGAGALGLMVLAVMTRACLGHSGLALRAGATMTASFGLVATAALIRGFGPAALPGLTAYGLAASAWILGFRLFLARFARILVVGGPNRT